MQNLLHTLKEALAHSPNYVIDGSLNKTRVEEAALELEPELLKILLSNPSLKKHFFVEIDSVQVFDKIKFQRFVNNKSFLPDSYTSYKNKIGLTDENGNFISESREVVLSWPYKDCVLEGGQDKEDAKRDEIFFNEILAPDQIDHLLEPKVLTNFKKYDASGEHDVTGITYDDNLLIKGNNLLALHSLEKVYAGKVKLIYIDPPYNTGNDSFGYNDRFNHSTWLLFMKNRLEVSKKLLSKDGFLLIHIDKNESAYLKVLCDEIYGSENYLNTIAIQDSHASGLKLAHKDKKIIKTKSEILVYRNSEQSRINPLYYSRDDWDTHFNTFLEIDGDKITKHSLSEKFLNDYPESGLEKLDTQSLKNKVFRQFAFENRHLIFQSTKEIPIDAKNKSLSNPDKVCTYVNLEGNTEYAFNGRRLSPLSKSIHNVGFDKYHNEDFGKLLCDFWGDIDFNNSQNEGGISFPNGKKPEYLMARLISMFSNKGDLILDFQFGSGSTGAVAHKLNRNFIGIEQLDYLNNDSLNRLKNVIEGDKTGISKYVNWQGGGSFIYCELAKCNQNFIDMAMDAKDDKALIELLDTIKDKGFISYKVDKDKFDGFETLSFDDKKKFLIEVLDKNMLYVNLSEIEDKDHGISDKDIQLNRLFYSLEKQQQVFAE